jgi:hypothetical protein
MPAQAGTQFFAIRCEIRWVPACAGMTETNHPWFFILDHSVIVRR